MAAVVFPVATALLVSLYFRGGIWLFPVVCFFVAVSSAPIIFLIAMPMEFVLQRLLGRFGETAVVLGGGIGPGGVVYVKAAGAQSIDALSGEPVFYFSILNLHGYQDIYLFSTLVGAVGALTALMYLLTLRYADRLLRAVVP